MRRAAWPLAVLWILAAAGGFASAQSGAGRGRGGSSSGTATGGGSAPTREKPGSGSTGSGTRAPNPVTINPGPGRAIVGPWVPPIWYGGWGYPPLPPLVFTPPPSVVYRLGVDGFPYSDLVTTPVVLGSPGYSPSFPLPPISAAETAAANAAAGPSRDPLANWPPVPPGRPGAANNANANAPAARARDPRQTDERIKLGDRLFRGDMLAQAVKRYEQAIKSDPNRAEPRARLAQVALVRGDYAAAANALREAEAAQPGWLATAGDVQALYREPADFARLIARLEAHLQARPEDRDGWLVLGALWYLSGRTEKAADIFLRLSDREPDPTLDAFLRASKAR